jgi:hypothetical protein
MYKKLPEYIYLHKHSKFQAPSGYLTDGLLVFTSEARVNKYEETIESGGKAYEKISTEELVKQLRGKKDELNPAGFPLTVIFNLWSSKSGIKYQSIYNVNELLNLINDSVNYCHVLGDAYQEHHFRDLLDQYEFQGELTSVLDKHSATEFDQSIINEIVLWKVNRYVSTNTAPDWLSQLNGFKDDKELDDIKLRHFLNHVLSDVNGIRLAMASTFLRFRNPLVYQIIDERMYRVIMRPKARHSKLGGFTRIPDQIDLYIDYLKQLRNVCDKYKIEFRDSDRILYQFDIIKNGDFN